MNRLSHYCCWMCMIMALAGCTGGDFSIEGHIDGVPDNMVTVAYPGDGGMQVQRVALTQGGLLKFKGTSSEYTLVSIWDSQGQIIAQLVAKNGDRMSVKSNAMQLPTTDIRGNEVTEQWMEFRKQHHDVFLAQDASQIDELIEKQIARHPDQLLSTVLLVAEYHQLADTDKARTLLGAIRAEARPQRLVSTLENTLQRRNAPSSLPGELNLYKHDHGIDDLSLQDRAAIILLWSRADDRQACTDTLRSLAGRHSNHLMIADVLIDPDTMQWHRNTCATGASWDHWWAPGGVMDPTLNDLGIDRTPTLIVTDANRHIVYAGPSPAQAVVALDKQVSTHP